MLASRWLWAAAVFAASPRIIPAQLKTDPDVVRLVRFEDDMASGVYAYVRGKQGIIRRIDNQGIVFSERDPAFVLACVSGAVVAVYRYGTPLMTADNAVKVQYRFDEQSPSPLQSWSAVRDPTMQAKAQAAARLMTADSAAAGGNRSLAALMGMTSQAAQLTPESTGPFLTAARGARQLTLRVTDPMDNETHTDVFSLAGLAPALDALSAECRR